MDMPGTGNDAAGRARASDARMGSEPVGGLIARFAVPVVVGLLVTRLYILVDGMFVGQALGPTGVAATTIAMPFITMLNAVVLMVGDGGTAVLALQLGANRRDGAARVLGNALVLLAVVSVVLGATVLLWADPLLAVAGASGEVLVQAKTYLVITVLGMFSLGFSLGIDTFLRAAGFPARTLAVQVSGAVINIVLGYLFVLRFGWGVAGAAAATVLGQTACLLLTVWFLFRSDMPFRLHIADVRPDGRLMGRIVLLGMPSFIVRASDAALNLVLNALVVGFGAATVIGGDGALAVSGAISRISQFALVPAIGIAVAARPLIGYNFGAQSGARVCSIVRTAVVAATLCLAAVWMFMLLDAEFLVGLFGFEGSVASFASWAVRIALLALPIIAVRIVGTNYYQAVGSANKAIGLTFCQQFVFLLPFLLVAPVVLPAVCSIGPLEAVFWGLFASDVLSTALVAFFLVREPTLRGAGRFHPGAESSKG